MRRFKPTAPTRFNRLQSRNLFSALVLAGSVARLLPHPPNMTPIGALAVWGGLRLTAPWNYAAVVAAMLISDIFLGFHATMPYVYGSLLVVTWLGNRAAKSAPSQVMGLTLAGAGIFFLVTNFGVWAATPFYRHTFAGLVQAYLAGLPFLRLSLLGDIIYVSGFFALEAVGRKLAASPFQTRPISTR